MPFCVLRKEEGMIMKKRVEQQYLQAKKDVEQYSNILQTAKDTILEFNTYLDAIAEQYEEFCQNSRNWARMEKVCTRDKKENKYGKYAGHDESRATIDSLLEQLSKVEGDFKYEWENRIDAISNMPVTSTEGAIREKFRLPIKRVRDRLSHYGKVEQIQTDREAYYAHISLRDRYKSMAEGFESRKQDILAELQSKYAQVRKMYDMLSTIERELVYISKVEKVLRTINGEFEHIQMPNVSLPEANVQLYDELCSNISGNAQEQQEEQSAESKESIIQGMIKDNVAQSVLPKLTCKTYRTASHLIKGGCCCRVMFNYAEHRQVKVEVDINKDDEFQLIHPFNRNGYAVIAVVGKNSQEFKAIDILGNTYVMKSADDEVALSPKASIIMDLLYERISLEDVDDTYFKSREFVQCAEYLLTRKHLYSRGLLNEGRNSYVREDKQAIKSIRSGIERKVNLSGTQTQDNTSNVTTQQ